MKANRFKDGRQGLSLNEVLIVLTMIGILVGVILPRLARAKHSKHPASCVNNLKQIGLSFRIYANDNSDRYPMEVPDSEGGAREAVDRGELFRVFQVMSNELSVPRPLICSVDRRTSATHWTNFGNSNISYFVGLDAMDTKPDMILAGDRNLALRGKLLTGTVDLGTNTPLTWTEQLHQKAGNIALADGSVQQVTTKLLLQTLASTGNASNRVLFPQ